MLNEGLRMRVFLFMVCWLLAAFIPVLANDFVEVSEDGVTYKYITFQAKQWREKGFNTSEFIICDSMILVNNKCHDGAFSQYMPDSLQDYLEKKTGFKVLLKGHKISGRGSHGSLTVRYQVLNERPDFNNEGWPNEAMDEVEKDSSSALLLFGIVAGVIGWLVIWGWIKGEGTTTSAGPGVQGYFSQTIQIPSTLMEIRTEAASRNVSPVRDEPVQEEPVIVSRSKQEPSNIEKRIKPGRRKVFIED